MAAAASWKDDDEWELVNDDGFVYKRKKRPRLDPSSAPSSSSSAPPPQPDLDLEHKNRRHRKKTALLKIKEKYEREIFQWEHLSNTLSNMQQKSSILLLQRPQEIHCATSSSGQFSGSPNPLQHSSDSACQRLIDELILQAEAQEAIIEDVANLCDIAEAICSEKEDQVKKSLAELPIWQSSPRELIMSLCDD